ncbi:intermediate filament family protein [Spirosoma pollinicola]|uniref:Uncharacterized protein n=1 Tax=Spirosoma pollinicola TaxID=2057025 RepID=A0A2K8Z2Z0_9BACT|nr:hypothetical protein [Spirosoma pollinicola]AUD04248.1 hypothetical protein CWM47_21830 [Spirosoma pollinicola]
MTTTERNPFSLASALAMLIIIGISGGLYWNHNRVMTIRYDQVEQRADSLLSVKLQLEGDIRSLVRQLETTTDENAYLTNRIDNLHQQLSERDEALAQLRQKAANRNLTIQDFRQIMDKLTLQRDSLTNQMEAMRDKIGWITKSNELVLEQNKSLQKMVDDLHVNLSTKIPYSSMTGDAFLVKAAKSNRKETAKAKKVRTLSISLNVPAQLQLEGRQNVYLSLTNEQHKVMMPPLRTTTVTLPNINEVIPIHAEQTVNFTGNSQRISFQFEPGETIKPGLYRASVYTKDRYLGAVEFSFRDSFWFF